MKAKAPAVEGVPLMMPPVVSTSPVGSDPEETVQLYPLPLPPVAERLALYAVPTVAPASAVVATDNGAVDGGGRTLELLAPHP